MKLDLLLPVTGRNLNVSLLQQRCFTLKIYFSYSFNSNFLSLYIFLITFKRLLTVSVLEYKNSNLALEVKLPLANFRRIQV